MDDFNILTDKDKGDAAYAVCVGGWVASGLVVGSAAPVLGTAVGALGGLAWSLVTCKHLQSPIKKALFSSASRLSDSQITAALRLIRQKQPLASKKEAMHLLAGTLREISRHPEKYGQSAKA